MLYSNNQEQLIYRYQPAPIRCSEDLLSELIEFSQISTDIVHEPFRDESNWNMGLSTTTGNVRDDNQDYGLCFNIGKYQVMIVADGMGGPPYGKRASYSVVKASAFSIMKDLGKRYKIFKPVLRDVVKQAVRTASMALSAKADKVDSYKKGLRTTLIVIIADKHEYVYGYIGDGSIILFQGNSFIHLLNPHKANMYIPNLLTASLGPTIHGEMVLGSHERKPNDFLITGTDGIFDRLEANPEDFPQGTNNFLSLLMNSVLESDGNLKELSKQTINELADFQDEQGYICNDNLTLGLLGNYKKPEVTCQKV